jgi:hypothetical protein
MKSTYNVLKAFALVGFVVVLFFFFFKGEWAGGECGGGVGDLWITCGDCVVCCCLFLLHA